LPHSVGALKVLRILVVKSKGTALFIPLIEGTIRKLGQVDSMFPNKHYEIEELVGMVKQHGDGR
jgi:hypothetical protein